MSYLELARKALGKQPTESPECDGQPECKPPPPVCSQGLGTEKANVYAGLPIVPTVPTGNSVPGENVIRPSNWRELLSGVGYRAKGRRATCPLCPPEKTGLAVSVTTWGVNCFRNRSHSRPWSAIVTASAVPARFAEAAGGQRRIDAAEADRVRRMLAREAAAYDWTFAQHAPGNHSYLLAKHIPPMGARIDARGKLLVPVYGLGRMGIEILFSLERIAPDGQKRFEADCRVSGGYCFVRADWESVDPPYRLGPIPEPHSQCVWICEGFATAATVGLATNEVACCVFSAGNLSPALEVLTRRMRATEFIIAADNDCQTPGNPGMTAALEAAERFQLRVACPEFPAGTQGSDWNDLAVVLESPDKLAHCREPGEEP